MPSMTDEYLRHVYGDFESRPSIGVQTAEKRFFDAIVLPHLTHAFSSDEPLADNC
jgi:hypothetical protein